MESDDSERDRPPQPAEQRSAADRRVTSGTLLDERAVLDALGRYGAHRMAIPLDRA